MKKNAIRRLIPMIILATLTSCSQGNKSDDGFIDKIIDLTIQTSTNEIVQFPGLYDTLADTIPDDKDEKLIIVEKLKELGFNVTNWGRGNIPPIGPRIINVELKKKNCTCNVSKVYLSTISDTLFQVVEGISCRRDN